MNTPNNKSSKETTAAIDAAFISLMKDKEIKEITVSEICETAKINRSTFYDHYADVLALMKAYSAKIEKQLESQPHTVGEFAWIFEYIKANADIFAIYFKIGISQLSADYKTLFFRNGVFAVAKMWFEDGCKDSAEQMEKIIKREYDKYLDILNEGTEL